MAKKVNEPKETKEKHSRGKTARTPVERAVLSEERFFGLLASVPWPAGWGPLSNSSATYHQIRV
jgi:hypothetical protein